MNIIDRYILRKIISTLLFALIALSVIFIVVSLLENLDEFLDQDATLIIIGEYYLNFLPEIFKILTPVATLLAVLFTIGRLSTINEVTAIKTGGMSLYRLMLPVLVVASLISIGQLFFNGWIVPRANQRKLVIEHEFLKKPNLNSTIYSLYLRDNPNTNLSMQYYDDNNQVGNRTNIDYFTNEISPRLTKRLEINRLKWDSTNNQWIMIDVIERNFLKDTVITTLLDSQRIDLNITHNKIVQLKRSPDEMTFDENRIFIDLLRQGGKDVRRQLIEYYGSYAFPFANIIVVLFGIPFASVRRKGGIAIQIGAAMIISFMYLVFTKISQTIGYSMNLDPILAGWMANIIFFIFGLITIYRTRT